GRIKNSKRTRRGVEEAALRGYEELKSGSVLDAVEACVCSMEDNATFNAGTGSVLNFDGEVEMDAIVMYKNMMGAVTCLKNIKNPVKVARKVMEESPHLILAGEGAYRFARNFFDRYDPKTEKRKKEFFEKKKNFLEEKSKLETVGACAFDEGELAVATSTGGLWLKLSGRVGDTPLPGCGTFLGSWGAVSATGIGENIIKSMFSRTVHDYMKTRDAKRAIELALPSSPNTGAIAIDHKGRIGFGKNTKNLVCAYFDESLHSFI
ncbi:MAG: isoaspartyl peptidase/L-asparaginase family protein, partial [Candidatus Methanofastidiosia archaeon]